MSENKDFIDNQKKKIDHILVMCNSYERFPMFLRISMEMDLRGELYWYALRYSYYCSDNLYQFRKAVKLAFASKEPQPEKLMSKRELNYLNKLPDTFTIYRGMTVDEFNSEDFGVSWTLKKSVAKFFSDEYIRNFDTKNCQKMVHQLTVNKSDVICYFDEREEYEIIYIHNNC